MYSESIISFFKFVKVTHPPINITFRKFGIEFKVVQRRNYTFELVNQSDLIISAGGDGTFLAAAKRVKDSSIPVIGINTDPIGCAF